MVERLYTPRSQELIIPQDPRFHERDAELRLKYPEVPANTFLLNGEYYAEVIANELRTKTAALKTHGIIPGLAAIVSKEDKGSLSYVQRKVAYAESVGIDARIFFIDNDTPRRELRGLIDDLNDDPRYHGVLLQVPLPPHLEQHQRLMEHRLNPQKDIDCMTLENKGLFQEGDPRFLPATPAGIMQMLRRSGVDLDGRDILVVGRSNLVGTPMAEYLFGREANATVTVAHSHTVNLAEKILRAEIIISAVGQQPDLITADMVREGVVVIDVANNRKADATRKSGWRTVGDVDFDGVSQKASAITITPGGVGPLTIAMVSANTILAAETFAV